MTTITATELKANLGQYLRLAAEEDIHITKNGRTIAKLVSPYQNRVKSMKSLFGILPNTMPVDEAKAERTDMR